MSAEIIQFVPRPNPNRERELERQAMEIANIAFPSVYGFAETVPYKGSGIDGIYTAPDKDAS